MIWCVEDDASIRDIEVYALTTTGFEAMGFEDGDSFWQALQSRQPELVVLDVMLPGKDGVTLLKMMKSSEQFRDIPVIMATAKGTEYDKIQSLDLGADDYLVKPFGIMEMVSRVKAVLRRCRRSGESNLLRIGDLVLHPSAEEKGVQLRVTGTDFAVRGVRRLLQEMLYNLCDNAIQYNVPGGQVRIHVENRTLTVSDTGIGIPAEHQARVFERFYRVDKSHSKASGGTGLGLSIVKHAVQYHKASVGLQSTPGKGTTITIQF